MRNSPARVAKRNLHGYAAHMRLWAHGVMCWGGTLQKGYAQTGAVVGQVRLIFEFGASFSFIGRTVCRGRVVVSGTMQRIPQQFCPFMTQKGRTLTPSAR